MRTWKRLGCLLLVAGVPAGAQAQDSATVVAGARYRAGPFKRLLLGTGYRSAWSEPVRVPVLDLGRFGGGLTPTEEGGGKGTESLRFTARDGKEYVFRSVDKTASRALPADLRGTIVEDVAQDQTSAKHPASALPVPPILDALGILHANPALYQMPDDARLGSFRERWRGRMGLVEERLSDDLAGRVFPGARELESTGDFLEKLLENPRNQVDAREYLVARLVDLWIGDWDRHPDQWRWARFDRGDQRVWRPVPRDRDNAFVRYEGLVSAISRASKPNLVHFDRRLNEVYGLHYYPAELDRRFLTALDRAQWDSITGWVKNRLTDELIDTAVARLPEPYRRLHGELLREGLQARRDQLPQAAGVLYDLVVRDADLHATDQADHVRVQRNPDGSLDVTMEARDGGATLRRRFVPAETRELRIYLHGGDDRLEADGPPAGAIRLRVIGGRGDDHLVERSASGGPSNQRFYDHHGHDVLEPGRGGVDRRPWEAPLSAPIGADPRPPRDYGDLASWASPHVGFKRNVGPVVGVQARFIRYGFRKVPFDRELALRALYAPTVAHGYGGELFWTAHHTGRPLYSTLSLAGNRYETWRFHGFGNDAPNSAPHEDYLVRHDFARAELLLNDSLSHGWTLSFGPTVAWRDPRPEPGSPAALGVPGGDTHTVGGARLRAAWDRRDSLAITRSGTYWSADGLAAAWSDGAPYGRLATEARLYLPVGSGGPALALRLGGERAVGDFPFQDAATLGGRTRVRGYSDARFTGDAASWGGAELRQPLGQVHLMVRGRLGLLVFGDAGRVWVDGDSPGDWHTGVGGGLWFEVLGNAGTLTYAHGETGRIYFTMGPTF